MRILAVDPGYDRLGIAIVEREGTGKESLLYSECLETQKKHRHEERLLVISKRLAEIIRDHSPSVLATETLFFSVNQKTALKVAEVRGVILTEAARASLPVFEYNPMQVKVAVTGYGKSDKDQVIFMTKKILRINKEALDDEYDAMAIGITCFATERFTEKK